MDSHDLVTHYSAVHAFATRFERSYLSADDITQEAYAEAYKSMRNRGPPRKPQSYLFTIARRVAQKEIRRYELFRGVGETEWESLQSEREQDPLESLLRLELREEVVKNLRRLAPVDELVLRQHYIEGRSCVEIGQELRLGTDAVKQRLLRARTRLTKAYMEED